MRTVLCILVLCVSLTGEAQSDYQYGFLPSLNLNKRWKNDWKVNLQIASRHEIKAGVFGENVDAEYEYLLTDVAFVGSKKIGLHHHLAGGYQIRFRDGAIFHRTIQQYVTVRAYNAFRLSHRIAADQTFSTTDRPEFRLRYRTTGVFPLSGNELDPKEWYFKVNTEYLNAIQSKVYDIELRLVPLLGYVFTDANKIEFGMDYRLNSFLNESPSHRFWWSINWFIVL